MLARAVAILSFITGTLFAQHGTGPLIDQRLSDFKNNPVLSPLPEIANDLSSIPGDWLALVCWNIQVGGTSPTVGALRPPMVGSALSRMFAGSYQLLAAQEISSSEHAQVLAGLLPGGSPASSLAHCWRANTTLCERGWDKRERAPLFRRQMQVAASI